MEEGGPFSFFAGVPQHMKHSFENSTADAVIEPSVPIKVENHPEVMLSASEASAFTAAPRRRTSE